MFRKLPHKLYFLLFLTFLNTNINSQINPGATQIALAHSAITSSNDIFAIFNNPGGIAFFNKRSLGMFYSPSPFGIKKLANGFLSFVEPTFIGNFSIGFMNYGFELYKENRFAISYSAFVYDGFSLGMSIFYNNLNIKRYGSIVQTNLSIGGIFKLNSQFSFGFSLNNLLRLSHQLVSAPFKYNLGFSYNPKKNSSINLAISKLIDFPFSVHFGFEYPLVEFLKLRIGTQTEPIFYNGGLGIYYSIFQLNYSVCSHQILGLTHQFDLILNLQ